MKRGFRVIAAFFVLLPLLVGSCMNGNDDIPNFNEQLEQDIAVIDNYLTAKNITNVIKDNSGIRLVIHVDSVTGSKPTVDSCVTANYQGLLLATEQEFDKGINISFPLSDVIHGWRIGIPLLNEGDSATLYIPSGYGYGYYGYPPEIPSNANLIFRVALKKVGETYKSSDRSCD